jgi:hypothetical protein
MTHKGDLTSCLVSHGMSFDIALFTVQRILDTARGPDFAQAYADSGDDTEDEATRKAAILLYWNVIDFLEDSIR